MKKWYALVFGIIFLVPVLIAIFLDPAAYKEAQNQNGSYNNQGSTTTNDDNDVNSNPPSQNSNKKTLYSTSVENFDFWERDFKMYNVKTDGRSITLNLSSSSCYYIDQTTSNDGGSVTIQGSCESSVQNNELIIEGNFSKLVIPSTYEQSMGVSSTSTTETSRVVFDIGTNGRYIKTGNVTCYESSYQEALDRNLDYILFDRDGEVLYDETGYSFTADRTIDLDDYTIKNVDNFPIN